MTVIRHQLSSGISSELELSSYHIWSWRECISIYENDDNIQKNCERYAKRILVDYLRSNRGIWLSDNNVLIEISAYKDHQTLEKVADLTAKFTKEQFTEWREFKIVEKMTSLYVSA